MTEIRGSAAASSASMTGLVARSFVLVVLFVAAAGMFAGVASAKLPCGIAVVNDWYGSKTGQLSGIYPLHCYRDALKIVAQRADLNVYSNAQQDILLALQQAIALGHAKPGALEALQTADALPSFLGGPDARNGGRSPSLDQPLTIRLRSIGKRRPAVFAPRIASSGASAIPLPAVVLAGIAALLLTLGLVAFHAKRRQART